MTDDDRAFLTRLLGPEMDPSEPFVAEISEVGKAVQFTSPDDIATVISVLVGSIVHDGAGGAVLGWSLSDNELAVRCVKALAKAA